jgi:hypothetical protein
VGSANEISFSFSLVKSRRQLVPSRNKASINLMMSQQLAVLILGYEHYLVHVLLYFPLQITVLQMGITLTF